MKAAAEEERLDSNRTYESEEAAPDKEQQQQEGEDEGEEEAEDEGDPDEDDFDYEDVGAHTLGLQ